VIIPPAPTVKINTDPGTEVPAGTIENWKSYPTHATVDVKTGETTIHQSESQEQFSARMEKMRKDAIDQLNQKHKEREEKPKKEEAAAPVPTDIAVAEPKKRRTRRSKTVSLGSTSTDVVQPQPPVPPPAQAAAPKEPETAPTKQTVDSAQAKAVAESTAPQSASTKKLTPEQLKPYRQRQFKLLESLEGSGFTPKEGMGNLDKLRNYVSIMFPDVSNFTEMTTDHWEKYLTAVEKKVAADAKAAIKHIEETIGI